MECTNCQKDKKHVKMFVPFAVARPAGAPITCLEIAMRVEMFHVALKM